MAKKILSFQEYSETIKADAKNEISEEENEECPCGTDEEGNCIECEETSELPDEQIEDEDSDDESEEAEEVEAEEPAAPAETSATVEEMLSEGYGKVSEAACAYEKDEYQDHTLEMYMKENAALVATLAATAMEEGYGEVKDEDMTQEMYEAICNEMKESYSKKIEELKEAWGAGKE